MKKKKYLPFYYEWIKTGKMSDDGLCYIFGQDYLFKLFIPNPEEELELERNLLPTIFWGKGTIDGLYNGGGFSPLRQNIVLLMAAMNNEL